MFEKKNHFEVWEYEGEISMILKGEREFLIKKKVLHPKSDLIHIITASTHEEAMSIRNLRLGFEPYKPIGEAEPCPNGCGSYYFPMGSGECAYCGKI